MLKAKKKICSKCGESQYIWKKQGSLLFCKNCWSSSNKLNNKPLKNTKPLSKKSSKQEKLDKAYSVIRAIYLTNNPYCKARLVDCQIMATDIHHKKLRGKYYLDDSTFLPVCRACHNFIHANPVLSRELGFLD